MVKNERGWTLTELLIVVAIIGITVMLAPQILTQSTKVYVLGRAKLELQREARAAIYLITRELRQAQSNTLIIDRAGGQPYYSRIRFTKIQGVNITIAQNGGTLQLTEGNATSTLTSNVAYVAFTLPRSDDLTIVSVAMTLQKQIYGGNYKALHMASERIRVMN